MSKSTQAIHASHEKIKRAKRKFDYLCSRINGFVQSDPYSVRFKTQGGHTYMIARLNKPPPDDLAWEVVEAVGHLRGALDKIIVELAAISKGGTSGIGFPFGGVGADGKPNPFPDARMEKGVKKKLTPEQWAIIETYKPYPRGNDTLWAVNEIANTDKHRQGLVEVRPILANSLVVNNGPFARGGFIRDLRVGPSDCNFVLDDEERETVMMSVAEGGFNINIECRAAPDVVFGNIAPVRRKSVLVTLNQQIQLVEGIVGAFRPTFPK